MAARQRFRCVVYLRDSLCDQLPGGKSGKNRIKVVYLVPNNGGGPCQCLVAYTSPLYSSVIFCFSGKQINLGSFIVQFFLHLRHKICAVNVFVLVKKPNGFQLDKYKEERVWGLVRRGESGKIEGIGLPIAIATRHQLQTPTRLPEDPAPFLPAPAPVAAIVHRLPAAFRTTGSSHLTFVSIAAKPPVAGSTV